MINIDEEVIYAECDVLIALSDCYIKEFLMEMNGCDSSQLFMESSKPKKSLKERFLEWIEKIKQMLQKIGAFLRRKWHKFTNLFKKGELVKVPDSISNDISFDRDLVKVQFEKFPHLKFEKYNKDDNFYRGPALKFKKIQENDKKSKEAFITWIEFRDVMINIDNLKLLSSVSYLSNDEIYGAFNSYMQTVEHCFNMRSVSKPDVKYLDELDGLARKAKDKLNDVIGQLNAMDIHSTENLKETQLAWSRYWDKIDDPAEKLTWLGMCKESIAKLTDEELNDPVIKKICAGYAEISSLYVKLRKLHSQKLNELYTMIEKEIFEFNKCIGNVRKLEKFKPTERENTKAWRERSDEY